jgi:hypothetical protein
MTNRVLGIGVILTIGVVAACQNPLTAINPNNPNIQQVFAQPASIEQTIGSGLQSCFNPGQGSGGSTTGGSDMNEQLLTMSMESYSQLNNFNMGPRGAVPRSPILNNKASAAALDGTFSTYQRNGRTVANAVAALDRLIKANGTLGSPSQNLRARAFGWFVMGCDMGWVSLTYDSAGIVDPSYASDFVPPLSGHAEVNAAALAAMDSAIANANASIAAAGANGFATGGATPGNWASGTTFTGTQFIQLVRSFKARFRASIALTPAERAAVDWSAVIADAEAGITSDVLVTVGGTSGWNIGFQGNQMHVDAGWHQISPYYWGMADVSGGYDSWLATPPGGRTYFLLITPDLRWPQGATRAAQRGVPEPDFVHVQAVHPQSYGPGHAGRCMGHFVLQPSPLSLHRAGGEHGQGAALPQVGSGPARR